MKNYRKELRTELIVQIVTVKTEMIQCVVVPYVNSQNKIRNLRICDAFLLNEAYVADSKVEQQAFICVKGVVW